MVRFSGGTRIGQMTEEKRVHGGSGTEETVIAAGVGGVAVGREAGHVAGNE